MGPASEQRHFRARNICIIGAGPSGLAAAKYLLAEDAFSQIVIYEQRSTVGGVWNYVPCESGLTNCISVPQTTPYPAGDHALQNGQAPPQAACRDALVTPIYDRLETNIPHQLMGFSDLAWPDQCQLFPRHQEVLAYLDAYAQPVRHLIRFETVVLDARQASDGGWIVKTRNATEDGASTIHAEHFDAVIVASGHFDVPYIPNVPGIEAWNAIFPGSIIHSKFYRRPEDYAGKKVVIVGNAASGTDIGSQISPYCHQPLLLSSRSESLFSGLKLDSQAQAELPAVAEFLPAEKSLRFADGTIQKDVDTIIYCTGYFYAFPFLSSLNTELISTGERVQNLYQHMFYQADPTLSFLGLNQKAIPFPLAEAQSAVIARVLSGRLALPGQAEMKRWEAGLMNEESRARDFHCFKFPGDAEYINELHDWATSADKTSGTCIGKAPPHWGEKMCWMREHFNAIRKAFRDLGDKRHGHCTLESVGYDFDEWKRQQHDEKIG